MNTLKIRRAITPVLLSTGLLSIAAPAWAAPPDDEPELQAPREVGAETATATEGEQAPPDGDEAGARAAGDAGAETSDGGDPIDGGDPNGGGEPGDGGDPADGGDPNDGDEAGDGPIDDESEAETGGDPEAAPPEDDPDGKFGNLLGDGTEGPDPQGDSTPRTFSEDGFDAGVSEDEKLARYYSALYRPKGNPGRIFFATRALFTNQSANNSAYFGRAGGVQLEVGQTWNKFGYGIAGSVYGGLLQLGSEATAVGNVMVGGGPSLSLGRLALVRRGFVDLRAGYDFFYVPLQATGVAADAPSAIAPHGFRVSLDLGLLLRSGRGKKLRHGVGLSLGYQGFVGSLVGTRLPYTSSLMTGLAYFFG